MKVRERNVCSETSSVNIGLATGVPVVVGEQ